MKKSPDFYQHAACKGKDPELFHPQPGDWDTHRKAVAICQTCPVQQACLEWALKNREKRGVWGGVSENQRREMRRVRRRGAA